MPRCLLQSRKEALYPFQENDLLSDHVWNVFLVFADAFHRFFAATTASKSFCSCRSYPMMQYASASLDLPKRRREPFLAYTLGWPCLLRHWTHTSGRAGQARGNFWDPFRRPSRNPRPPRGAMCCGAWLQRVGYVNQVQAAPIVLRLRPVEVTLCVVWIERDSPVMIFHGEVKQAVVFIVGDQL